MMQSGDVFMSVLFVVNNIFRQSNNKKRVYDGSHFYRQKESEKIVSSKQHASDV
jgi:hypothetical protein